MALFTCVSPPTPTDTLLLPCAQQGPLRCENAAVSCPLAPGPPGKESEIDGAGGLTITVFYKHTDLAKTPPYLIG